MPRRNRRLYVAGVLIVCLMSAEWSDTLFASDDEAPANAPSSLALIDRTPRSRFAVDSAMLVAITPVTPATGTWRSQFQFGDVESDAFGQRGYRGRGRGRNGGAQAAVILGAVASITGAALLAYANRPECSANQRADGCGYGTKVIGGAVLGGGLVSLAVGALTWR